MSTLDQGNLSCWVNDMDYMDVYGKLTLKKAKLAILNAGFFPPRFPVKSPLDNSDDSGLE